MKEKLSKSMQKKHPQELEIEGEEEVVEEGAVVDRIKQYIYQKTP